MARIYKLLPSARKMMALSRLFHSILVQELCMFRLTLKLHFTGKLCHRQLVKENYLEQIRKALKPGCVVSFSLVKVKSKSVKDMLVNIKDSLGGVSS